MAGCEDLGGPGAGPGLAGGAARPGRVKSPLVFLRPVLCSALPLLGDSSCGFHSAAPRPAQQHRSAAAEDDDDEDDDNIDEYDDDNSDDNQEREGALSFPFY